MRYWILTKDGIRDLDGNTIVTPFEGQLVHHGQFGNNQLTVIVDRREIWSYNEKEWTKVATGDRDLNCLLWTPNGLLVGTDQARLAWVSEEKLVYIDSFDEIETRRSWTTPGGGAPDVRSLSLDQNGTIYANIHVGWIVRSLDGGVSWEPCKNGLEKDVHMVASHPTEEGVLLVATARGFHISQDSGQTFTRKWEKYSQKYQRATEAFAGSETILVSVSNGPHSGGAKLYRSGDRGSTWTRVLDIPEQISLNINTYQITTGHTGIGFVIVENNKLYKTTNHGKTWKKVVEDVPKAYQVVGVPEID